MTAFQERLGRFIVQTMTGPNNVVYRLSNGRVAGRTPSGAPICLVTTVGRKTGRARTVPLVYVTDGDRIVVVASKGGMSTHPAWYLNLQADPRATLHIGSSRRAVRARPATATERGDLWPQLVAVYGLFNAYQARTDRDLPLVVLEPEHR